MTKCILTSAKRLQVVKKHNLLHWICTFCKLVGDFDQKQLFLEIVWYIIWLFGFYWCIGIGQNGQFCRLQWVLTKCFDIYSSRIRITCTRKHNEPSQDSYLVATLATVFL